MLLGMGGCWSFTPPQAIADEQIAYLVLNFDEDIRRRLAPAKP
jgi:hypothetical protein